MVSNIGNVKSLSRTVLNQGKNSFMCKEKLFILNTNNH